MPNVSINHERCKGCGLCVDVCPKKIMKLMSDFMNAKGLHPAQVTDQEKCIACAFCATMCPDAVITIEK